MGLPLQGEGRPTPVHERLGLAAVRRRFSPEFVNRVDRTLTYKPLTGEAFEQILDIQLDQLDRHIAARLGEAAFILKLTANAREFLLCRGTSAEYGARELKRGIHRHLIQPVARLVLRQFVEPGSLVKVDVATGGGDLAFYSRTGRQLAA